MKDYYELLGCHPSASAEEIKRSYRELAGKLHPDRNSPRLKSWSERQMAAINEAYEVLGDPHRRAGYDQARRLGIVAPSRGQVPAVPDLTALASLLKRYAVTAVFLTIAIALLPTLLRFVVMSPRGIVSILLIVVLWLGVSRLRRGKRSK
ncbi:MAG: DnaJ domain-containing protein [Chloroflexi bacterium]|nr:DnaJ domain-containing protein [Chloroflexota bacterium]